VDQQCRCGCSDVVLTGHGYAGADESERNRHRSRLAGKIKNQERAREKRRHEQQSLLEQHGLLGLPLTGLVEAAQTHAALAQALAEEAVTRADRCDEATVLARIAAVTEQAIARITTTEIENQKLRQDLTGAQARIVAAEARAQTADRDAITMQRRLDKAGKASVEPGPDGS
jgi:hypothetical protein